MKRDYIENEVKKLVQKYFDCNNKKYSCEERDYCVFWNGTNNANNCKEDCLADIYSEGLFDGVKLHKNMIWHNIEDMPPMDSHIGILLKSGTVVTWFVNSDIGEDFRQLKAKKWCYIQDILPDKK